MSDSLGEGGGHTPLGPYWWWHTWTGVTALHYASRLRSSPPIVLKAPTCDQLLTLVEQWITTHDDWPGKPWPPAYNLGHPPANPGASTK